MPNINLTLLMQMQGELEDSINQKRKIKKSLIHEKTLALNVELAELAQEWGLFKYWKKKPTTKSRAQVLEEYADGLHFILSLAIERLKTLPELRFLEVEYPDYTPNYSTKQIIEMFNELYKQIANLHDSDRASFIHLFTLYFKLGHALGFTFEEVSYSYYQKNEINHIRLKEGY